MKLSLYITTGLILVGGFILLLSTKVANYGEYFFIVGALMAIIGFLMLKIQNRYDKKKDERLFEKWRKDLKSTGIKVGVDFDKCVVKSNKYREEIVKENHSTTDKYMALDALVGRDNVEYNNVDQSVIVFETELNGRMRVFVSPLLNIEQTTLRFLLADKKYTKIYVDRNDADDYYFDLEFMRK